MSYRAFVLIDPSSDSSSVDDSSIEAKIDSSYATLRSFPTKFTSSNCEKVMILPACSWDDVAYRIYNTYGCITSASEYLRDMYDNALEKRFKYNVMRQNYFKCTRYVDEVPFLMLCNSIEDTPKTLL